MSRRAPIEKIVSDPETSPTLRTQLEMAIEIRDFAARELGLPDDASYRTYVDVGAPYVVWNVVATPEFSLDPKTWCFLVVGCLAYRGYFDRADAERHAQQLREQGYDVYVGGVRAYSTLGWFDDPLLNTMVAQGEAELAAVVFHELTHQLIYIDDDTAFNEAFAVAVEREGVRRWFAAKDDAGAFEAYLETRARDQQFIELMLEGRDALGGLYAQPLEEEEMRARKAIILADIEARNAETDPQGRYAGWFRNDFNNAKLALLATYWAWVPAFERMLREHGGDLETFYEAVAELGAMSAEQRHSQIESLLTK